MKKFLFSIALTITLGLTASAQFNINTDGFFNDWDDNDDRFSDAGLSFVLPTNHGFGDDANSTPLGSGLLVLTSLGAGYALKKKLEK